MPLNCCQYTYVYLGKEKSGVRNCSKFGQKVRIKCTLVHKKYT